MAQTAIHREGAKTPVEGTYQPIHLRTLQHDAILEFDLFISHPPGSGTTLYREASLPFSRDARERLMENSIETLWVRAADRALYRRYVETHLGVILGDETLPLEERAALLYESCQELVKTVLRDPRSKALIRRCGLAVQHMVGLLYGNSAAFTCLAQLTWKDYETYSHCVDVCVFATALACRLGFKQEKAREIALGALLHDVGKCELEPAILKKAGPLSDAEWDLMRQHPLHSERILRDNGIHERVVLDIARHHHEKLSGDGYPDGLPAKGITPWVRIVTIADVFSALTTDRSFGKRMRSFEALQLMRDEMGSALDARYLREFVKLLAGQ